MGNTSSINYQQNVNEGIPLIKEWIQTKKEEFEEKDEFKELVRVITEIEAEQDYSEQAYKDIRYLLRPFEYLRMLDLNNRFLFQSHSQL